MKKGLVVLVLMVFLVIGDSFAGGLFIKFIAPTDMVKSFAREFISELKARRQEIRQLLGEHLILGFLGGQPNPEKNGQEESAIGIFVDLELVPLVRVWVRDLASDKGVSVRAKEAADEVLKCLKEREENEIKIRRARHKITV
ncbi:MAG: hypothetical protein V1845_03965 [bacterium]